MGNSLFIINPGASGGQGESTWEKFQSLWPDDVDPADVCITEHPDHATEIATSADGYQTLVAVGGDGSVHEILNGIMTRSEPRPHLAIIPAGTGNDIARAVGVFPLETAVGALKGGRERSFDLIRVDGRLHDRAFTRYAFMTAGIGFSPTASTKPWTKRLLGATAAYYLNTVVSIVAHKPPAMSIQWDGGHFQGPTWMVIVSNVESVSGGSMRIAPGAGPHDGKLWVTIVEPRPKLVMMLKVLPKVASGDHVNEKGFRFFSTSRLEITSDVPAIMDPDGEIQWATRITEKIVPGAVTIFSPTGDR